jgi:RNA polymerase sigma-70 factor (ECF subfamily)
MPTRSRRRCESWPATDVQSQEGLREDSDRDVALDIALMGRVVRRDERAIGELYDRHSGVLFGLILRILHDRGEAEEVLQEVFMQVWTRAESYNVSLGSPAGWLVRIARNRAIDRLRANAVRLRAVVAAPPPVEGASPEAQTALGELRRIVARALDALPAEQRSLIEQAYFLGLTQSELAERCKLPLGTVKTRIRSGMLALREALGPEFADSAEGSEELGRAVGRGGPGGPAEPGERGEQ